MVKWGYPLLRTDKNGWIELTREDRREMLGFGEEELVSGFNNGYRENHSAQVR
jgi:hypothetical protein